MAKSSGTSRRKSATNSRTRPTVKASDSEVLQPKIPLLGRVIWNDPQKEPTSFCLDADFDPRHETGHVCLTVNLRPIFSIELRPLRRPLKNASGCVDPGHVEDALRLANEV